MVTVLGRPGRGASQVKKTQSLNWATQFLMVAHDGVYSPNDPVRMHEFSSATCLAGKTIDDSSCHHVVEIARIA